MPTAQHVFKIFLAAPKGLGDNSLCYQSRIAINLNLAQLSRGSQRHENTNFSMTASELSKPRFMLELSFGLRGSVRYDGPAD
jgi:hypothetical protein